ncbi:uncharacterized protein LOC108869710 [Brassica rapa]|nr:uncharacterized protein LOC108869710 [Brassica rapa]
MKYFLHREQKKRIIIVEISMIRDKEHKIGKSKHLDEKECLLYYGIERVVREEPDLAEAGFANRVVVLNPSSISAFSRSFPFQPELEDKRS